MSTDAVSCLREPGSDVWAVVYCRDKSQHYQGQSSAKCRQLGKWWEWSRTLLHDGFYTTRLATGRLLLREGEHKY